MRFENNNSAHPAGIESIVNVARFASQGLPYDEDRVKVDYIYFNNLASTKACDVDGISPNLNFVIPQDRTTLYQIDGLDYNTTCP